MGTKYSEIQAVGFENYLKGQLGIYGGPRLNYSPQGNRLLTGPPIHMYRKLGRFWGTNPWSLEDFSKNRVDKWMNIHNKALKK